MSPALAYLRVSTLDQPDSLKTQRDTLLREAAHRGTPIADADVFQDEGVSGATPFLERPGVQALMARAVGTGCRTLYVAKVDRAFRDMADAAFTIKALLAQKWDIYFLDFFGEKVNPRTAMGKLMLNMAVMAAEFERMRLAERIRESAKARKARGELAGNVPYGADRVPSPTRKVKPQPGAEGADRLARYGDAAFDLAPNALEQQVLARLRTGDLSTVSDNEASRRLNREGIPAKKGGQWFGATVRAVKRNGWTPAA